MNPNNGNKTKSNIFHGTYSPYLFLSKNVMETPCFDKKVMVSKLKLLNSMTKVNPYNGNETKSDIFPWDILKTDIIFHQSQNTKMF